MVPGASDNCTLLATPLGTPSPVSTAAVSLPSSSPALGGGHMALDLAVSSIVTTIHRKEKRWTQTLVVAIAAISTLKNYD